MCSHKASGGNEVIAEYYRASSTARGYLLRLVNQIWMGEELPNEWTRGIICPIYIRKSARDDPANYRMICLLSHLYKFFPVNLVQRIQKVIEATIQDNQNGFCPQRGYRDDLYILRVILEINKGILLRSQNGI